MSEPRSLHIRFIQNEYEPHVSGVAQMVADLAVHLAGQGHHVSILANTQCVGINGPVQAPREEVLNGVYIRRVGALRQVKDRSMLWRLLEDANFFVRATFVALFSIRADVVVILTNPPLMAAIGGMLARIKGERFIHIVMDLYPDTLIASGMLRAESLLGRLLAGIARHIFNTAEQIIVLGECMAESVISKGGAPAKVKIIRNWADEHSIGASQTGEAFRAAHGLQGRFVVMYSGNFGLVHYFDDLLEVCERVRHHDEITFVLIGDGAQISQIRRLVETRRLSNVIMLPFQDRCHLPETLMAADVHFVSLRAGFEGLVVPSKAYGILATGRPVLYQGSERGEIARMIRKAGCGHIIRQGDPRALEAAILTLYRDPKSCRLLGKRGRAVIEAEYSMSQALSAYVNALLPRSGV